MLFDAYVHPTVTGHNRHSVMLCQSKVVHYDNFEMLPHHSNLMHNRHQHERKLYKCRNDSIISRPGLFLDEPLLVICSGLEELY